LTTKERAARQRIMMALRKWMEMNDISRQAVADELGITRGHLSTLINANRSATEEHCEKVMILMDAKFAVSKKDPLYKELGVKPLVKRKEMRPEPKKKKTKKLRPLSKFECEFVADVAKAWVKANKNSSQSEFVEVVRALSIGIRS